MATKKQTKEALVPELRFPEFEAEPKWKEGSLASAATIPKKKISVKRLSLATYATTENIQPNFGGLSHASQLPNVKFVTEFLPGDTLFANIRPYLKKAVFVTRDGGASNDVIVLRSRNTVFPGFLSQRIRTDAFVDYVMSGAKGLKMPRGDVEHIKAFPLPLPSPAEQQKIADCLGSLDGLIAAHRRKLDAFQDHKKGLLQQLFPAEGETTPKLRFSEFWNSGEWSIERAANIFSNRSTRGKRKLPIYSISQTDGLVRRSTLKRKIEDIADPSGNKTVRKGDLAYNMMRMWQGAVGVAAEDCLVSPAYVVLAPSKTVVSQFYAYYFKTHEALQLLEGHSRGLTKDRLRLYYEDFGRIPLPFPSKKEQQKIADCLSTLDALITAQTEQIAVLKTHKKGLMQQLFPSSNPTGKQAS